MNKNKTYYEEIRKRLPLFVKVRKEVLDYKIKYLTDTYKKSILVKDLFSLKQYYICTDISFREDLNKVYFKILGYKMVYEDTIFELIDSSLILPN